MCIWLDNLGEANIGEKVLGGCGIQQRHRFAFGKKKIIN